MATLTIRNLPEQVRNKLRMRAARRGVSMEAEARAILAKAVIGRAEPSPGNAAGALQDWIATVRRPPRTDKASVESLIRDRRRDAILEIISDGLDPAEALGANYARIVAEAEWTPAHVRQLRRNSG
jgi:plasmid stability protein